MIYITSMSNYKNLKPNVVPIFATVAQVPYGRIRMDELIPDSIIIDNWINNKDKEATKKEYLDNILLPLDQYIILKRMWSYMNYDEGKDNCIILDDTIMEPISEVLKEWFEEKNFKVSTINIAH